jgi:peptidoglycan/LPS O-acetylase OafA/YrhL
MPAAEHRFTHLDGLRGLACLTVAMCHFVIAFYETLLDGDPVHMHNGWELAASHSNLILFYDPGLGVAVFFVLSGFVLAASVANVQPAWPRLAVRRWVRLCLPILAIATLVWLALKAGAFRDIQLAAPATKSDWLGQFFPPMAYLFPYSWYVWNICVTFFEGDPGPTQILIGTLWTMPIELIGSLVLFAGYCFGSDVFRRIRGCVAVSLLLVVWTWNTPYYGFGLGVALFELRRAHGFLPSRWQAFLAPAAQPIGWLALAAGLWAGATPYALTSQDAAFISLAARVGVPVGVTSLTHAGACLIVLSALLLRPFQTLLQSRVCQYFGRISYMLYLVQNPVECSVGVYVFLHAGHDYNARAVASLVAYLAASILLADITTRLFDRPAIYLSRFASSLPIPGIKWARAKFRRLTGMRAERRAQHH